MHFTINSYHRGIANCRIALQHYRNKKELFELDAMDKMAIRLNLSRLKKFTAVIDTHKLNYK